MQHLPEVYPPGFEIPKFFWDANLGAVPLRRFLPENTLTDLFVSGSTDATGHLYFISAALRQHELNGNIIFAEGTPNLMQGLPAFQRPHMSARWSEDSFHRLCVMNTTF